MLVSINLKIRIVAVEAGTSYIEANLKGVINYYSFNFKDNTLEIYEIRIYI